MEVNLWVIAKFRLINTNLSEADDTPPRMIMSHYQIFLRGLDDILFVPSSSSRDFAWAATGRVESLGLVTAVCTYSIDSTSTNRGKSGNGL